MAQITPFQIEEALAHTLISSQSSYKERWGQKGITRIRPFSFAPADPRKNRQDDPPYLFEFDTIEMVRVFMDENPRFGQPTLRDIVDNEHLLKCEWFNIGQPSLTMFLKGVPWRDLKQWYANNAVDDAVALISARSKRINFRSEDDYVLAKLAF